MTHTRIDVPCFIFLFRVNIFNCTFHQEAAAEYLKKVETLMLDDLNDDDKLNLALLQYDLAVYTRGLQYKG